MSHQITKVDLIPNGELSVCNVSQFDNGRVLPFEILENKEAYNIPNDIRVELHCRKPDGNIVTLPSENITDNIVTFLSTTQLTACYGKNVCEIALYGPDDYLIGSGNFILDVEKSPTLGGITSTSEIHNLETQVEEITTEVIGENYYNKTEVDDLLDTKADASSVYTKTQVDSALALKANAADVYTKSQVDSALALKANAADVYTKSQVDSALALKANAADVYTKSQVDSALALKANAADVYTKSQVDSALAAKANAADVYTKQEVDNKIFDIMPVGTASGPIATFNTELTAPLVNVSCDIVATGGNGTPDNPNPINGYTEANITRCGVNIWNEETANGYYSIGVFIPANNTLCSKDMFRVNPSSSYYFVAPEKSITVVCYDENGVFLNNIYDKGNSVFTVPNNCYFINWYRLFGSGGTYEHNISINSDSTDMEYHAYNGQTYTIAFGQTVYGGVLDVTKGKLKPCIEYPSYNGETLSGRWLSSEATYVEGTTPPTGSQVVSLDDYGSDIDLTPEVISAVVGANNVSSNTGPVTVRFKTTIEDYINGRINRANTNRSLLSSVNSDIIKEKSEIKEQSDIIEDNERGEENE